MMTLRMRFFSILFISTVTIGGVQQLLCAPAPLEKQFQVAAESEVLLDLDDASPGTSWNEPLSEAAVATIMVDGQYHQDLILFAGARMFTYSVMLGRLMPGTHTLHVEQNPKWSAANASVIEIADARISTVDQSNPEFKALALAPFLYARPDTIGRFSDAPLLAWYEIDRGPSKTTIRYSIIFTNEDGGTQTNALMARWGRTTDIDYGYRAWLDANGRFLRATIQAKDHKELEFQGQREGSHPVLVVATDNNMVSDDGTSAVRYQIAPILVDLSSHSREQVMDEHPLTYRVMAQELAREAKLRPFGAVDGERISDPRNYLYVEARLLNRQTGVSVLVRRRGDGVWRSSDLGRLNLAVSRDGWVRTTVELPPGTSAKDLSEIAFACLVMPDEKFNFPQSNPCRVEAVSKVFFLGRDYAPGPSAWSLAAPLVIPAGEVRAFPLGR
jgi:hypothetical protein